MITPRAPPSQLAYVRASPSVNKSEFLGFRFRGHKCFSSFSPSSASVSPDNNKAEASGSEGSGIVVAMGVGQENGVKADHDDWYDDDDRQDQQMQQHRQEQQSQSSSKFITLPTVLTLGRVAAVPLLIASMFFCVLLF